MGLFDNKICKCSKDNYTKFFNCCCSLPNGILIWSGLEIVIYCCQMITVFAGQSYYCPVLALAGAIFGFVGVRKEGRQGARYLRLYGFLNIVNAIAMGIVVFVYMIVLLTNWDDAVRGYDESYVVAELCYEIACVVFGFGILHFLVSSIESLAKQKEHAILPQHIDDNYPVVQRNEYQEQTVNNYHQTQQEPHVIYVQHEMK